MKREREREREGEQEINLYGKHLGTTLRRLVVPQTADDIVSTKNIIKTVAHAENHTSPVYGHIQDSVSDNEKRSLSVVIRRA
jgi:hypothetical protein